MDLLYFSKFQKLIDQIKILEEKTGLNDIKTSYSNLETLYEIINKMKEIPDYIFPNFSNSKKEFLNKIDENLIKKNIDIIINESSKSIKKLLEKEDNEDQLKSVVLDIQKSPFYEEYKDNFKIKEMEINLIMIESETEKDLYNTIEKLIEMDKKVFYRELKGLIKDFIDQCEESIIIKEKREIHELIIQENFEKVFEKYEKLFKDLPNKFNYIYKEYKCY